MSKPSNDDIADEVKVKSVELRDLVDEGSLAEADDLFGETWKLFLKLNKEHARYSNLKTKLDNLKDDIEALRKQKKAASSSSSSAGESGVMVFGGVC
ncbi:MAG: hypothetical protein IPL25_20315 [Saprospiraceae bacterium]|nr:hypothetical protein [Candidatus Vicinibacter affinis]